MYEIAINGEIWVDLLLWINKFMKWIVWLMAWSTKHQLNLCAGFLKNQLETVDIRILEVNQSTIKIENYGSYQVSLFLCITLKISRLRKPDSQSPKRSSTAFCCCAWVLVILSVSWIDDNQLDFNTQYLWMNTFVGGYAWIGSVCSVLFGILVSAGNLRRCCIAGWSANCGWRQLDFPVFSFMNQLRQLRESGCHLRCAYLFSSWPR